MNLEDNNLALTSQVNKNRNIHKNKSTLEKRQGFKGNWRKCGKYGYKAADCQVRGENQNNNNKKKFQGKCNYCGIEGHKEVNCWKKDENTNQYKANIADDNKETV